MFDVYVAVLLIVVLLLVLSYRVGMESGRTYRGNWRVRLYDALNVALDQEHEGDTAHCIYVLDDARWWVENAMLAELEGVGEPPPSFRERWRERAVFRLGLPFIPPDN